MKDQSTFKQLYEDEGAVYEHNVIKMLNYIK